MGRRKEPLTLEKEAYNKMIDEQRIAAGYTKGMPAKGGRVKLEDNAATTHGLTATPEENSDIISFTMKVGQLPIINNKDAQQVNDRIFEYFRLCMEAGFKPTVSGLALSMNMTRIMLQAIVNNRRTGGCDYLAAVPPDVALVIKRGYAYMENLWEGYFQSGKINPVVGIFLGTNNYGYQNKAEHVITPSTLEGDADSVTSIKEKYEALSDGGKKLLE